MGAVILDFDSTLVPCESLEEALARGEGVDDEGRRRLAEITRLGMEGAISFGESLETRLEIARPRREDLERLGHDLASTLTEGAADLVARLTARGHEVWIVSGAFLEVLLPTARVLAIPRSRVCGVRAHWNADGSFAGLDPGDPFARSKVEGARSRGSWSRPAVGVGDGATDLALLDAGLVDRFVGYVEHVRRHAVTQRGVPLAPTMKELEALLLELLP